MVVVLIITITNLYSQGEIEITNDTGCDYVLDVDKDCHAAGTPGVFDAPKNDVKTYDLSDACSGCDVGGDIISLWVKNTDVGGTDDIDIDCGDYHNPPYTLFDACQGSSRTIEWNVNGSDLEIWIY